MNVHFHDNFLLRMPKKTMHVQFAGNDFNVKAFGEVSTASGNAMGDDPWFDHSFATKLCEIYTWRPREIGNDWRKMPWMFAQRALFLEMHHTYAWNLIKPTSTKFTSPPAQVDPTQFLLISF